ncbi:hypothetical protein MTR67_001643 [Solanum verrucosum]|uniref:Transposon protein, putative, CACTA, En/Spm sub-class n=1 Tax=Solanum verrucosum TaxID=315347 RepID=A0AAF0T8L8_SOLVR|nr:hypothetical protein MTR67_001643 [Solanum verrucosum]
MCSKTADSLRWHDEERSKDGKLRHPADGQAWKDFDRLHPDFALDSRNHNLLRHNLDVLHIEKNIVDSILGTLLDIPGKIKDHAKAQQRDARHKTQNSGVTLVASTTSFASSKDKKPIAADLSYYGRIVNIVELDYYSHIKEEPFVLASQVHQCFYMQDLYHQDRHYVMKTVPRDLFNMSDEFESDLPQSYENELSEHLMGPSIPEDDGEVPLVRTYVPENVIDVPSEEFVTQQLEVEYEKEF